jgi:hypothetical protein
MAYVPHIKLTFGGTLGIADVQEAWSCGLSIGGEGTDAVLTNPQENLQPITDALVAWMTRSASGISPAAALGFVKLAQVNSEGKYVTPAVVWLNDTVQASGAGSGSQHPFQIAQVISLNTVVDNPTGRGRFYSPLPRAAVEYDGMIAEAAASATAGSAATLLSDLNSAIAGAARIVVASSTGVNRTVTSVRVGRVLDTVRSRRTSLDENYSPNSPVSNA